MTTFDHLFFSAMTIAQTDPADGKSILDHINSGGVIGYLIIILSFVAMLLFVSQMIQVREARLAPAELVERLHQLFKGGDVKGAIRYCQAPENDCFLTRVVGTALVRCARSPFGFLELKSALEEAGQAQVANLYRGTDGIGLVAAIAPMLGLLGTVVGMVGAFDVIASSEGFASPDQLAGDISKALITTVLGLIVAIPATGVFTYLRNRIDSRIADVAAIIEDLAWHLEAGGEQGGQRSQRPPARPPARPDPGSRPVAGAPRQ